MTFTCLIPTARIKRWRLRGRWVLTLRSANLTIGPRIRTGPLRIYHFENNWVFHLDADERVTPELAVKHPAGRRESGEQRCVSNPAPRLLGKSLAQARADIFALHAVVSSGEDAL